MRPLQIKSSMLRINSFYHWFAKHISAVLFCLEIHNFSPLPFFWAVVEPTDVANGYIHSQNSNTIQVYLALKILLHFQVFPGGVENAYSQLSRKLFNHFENCLWIMIKVLDFLFYKKCAAWTEVAAQIRLNIPDYKYVIWKNRKNADYLYDTFQPIFIKFSPEWSQSIWPSHSWNRWYWKCMSKSTFTKMLIFDTPLFLKKLPTSNIADGKR